MEALAALVSDGRILADVGCDHGYLPIYLVQQGRIPSAIAMDVRSGPLDRAREHITSYGLNDRISTRLSDGLQGLASGEAESILIAGMGGDTILHILTQGEERAKEAAELILQPQSEVARVREYLLSQGYVFLAEDMVEEDGKFYPMMKVCWKGNGAVTWTEAQLAYGKLLIEQAHPVLISYLQYDRSVQKKILSGLMTAEKTEKLTERKQQVEHRLQLISEVLQEMTGGEMTDGIPEAR